MQILQPSKIFCEECDKIIIPSEYEPIELPCHHQFHRMCIQDTLFQLTKSMRSTLICPVKECSKEVKFTDYAKLQDKLGKDYYFCIICRQYSTTLKSMIKSLCKPGEYYHEACFEKGTKVVKEIEPQEEVKSPSLMESSILDSWLIVSNSQIDKLGTVKLPKLCAGCNKNPEQYLICQEEHFLCKSCGQKQISDRINNKSSMFAFTCNKCKKDHQIQFILLECGDKLFYEDVVEEIFSEPSKTISCIMCNSRIKNKGFDSLIKDKKNDTISKKFAVK